MYTHFLVLGMDSHSAPAAVFRSVTFGSLGLGVSVSCTGWWRPPSRVTRLPSCGCTAWTVVLSPSLRRMTSPGTWEPSGPSARTPSRRTVAVLSVQYNQPSGSRYPRTFKHCCDDRISACYLDIELFVYFKSGTSHGGPRNFGSDREYPDRNVGLVCGDLMV